MKKIKIYDGAGELDIFTKVDFYGDDKKEYLYSFERILLEALDTRNYINSTYFYKDLAVEVEDSV